MRTCSVIWLSAARLILVMMLLTPSLHVPAAGTGQPASESPATLVWSGLPLPLPLKPDTHRLVIFPYPVEVQVPKALAPQLAVEITRPGYILFRPAIAFAQTPIRVIRTDMDERGEASAMILLVTASPAGSANTLQIVDSLDATDQDRAVAEQHPKMPAFVALLRHAAQSLYAPQRLLPRPGPIQAVPAPNSAPSNLLRSQQGESFSLHPVAAWRGLGYHIIAIELVNQTAIAVELDPRQVRGDWQAISFQHPDVKASGSPRDRSVLYLISRNRFGEPNARNQ